MEKKQMQAWQQAKVMNPDSEHTGRAGLVVRVEKKDAGELVFVNLDADTERHEEVVSFTDAELVIL